VTNFSERTFDQERRLSGLALALWLLWQPIRFTALALLMILEPLVRFVLGGSALLMMLSALFLKATLSRPFPFWGMLVASVGCMFLLVLYYSLMRLLR
jgi:hypothetical protein